MGEGNFFSITRGQTMKLETFYNPFLLLILIWVRIFNRLNTSSMICTSSTSFNNDLLPITSTSHWKNSRYRPFWGLSALHTGWIWYRLKGNVMSFRCCTTYLAKGTVRSYRNPFSVIQVVNSELFGFWNFDSGILLR